MARKRRGRPDESLTLVISGEVTLPRLLSASQSFLKILREVEHGVSGQQRDAVSWVVSAAQKNSVELQVTGYLADAKAPFRTITQTVHGVISGIRTVSKQAKRPRYFSDAALEETKALATLASVSVMNGSDPAPLTQRVVEHVEKLIGPQVTTVGSVVGKLEGLSIHGRRIFVLYEQLTNRRVECLFADRMLQTALHGFGKLVSVYGTIRSRETGEKLSVDIEEMEIFPDDEELPNPDDVRGILN